MEEEPDEIKREVNLKSVEILCSKSSEFGTESSSTPMSEVSCGNVTISEDTPLTESTVIDYSQKVLDPENPLLEKFQRALKDHLTKKIEWLKDEIFDYDLGIKDTNAQRDVLGVQVYNTQQLVVKQQTELENRVNQLETLVAAKEQMAHELEEAKKVYSDQRDTLFQAEKEEIQLRNEVESTNLLIQQMTKWEESLESDITVKQRISEKTKKDKLRLAEEKRYQDLLIYKLMTRIWELEGDLDTMDMQLLVKEREREELAQAVAFGSTNIEAVAAEHRGLMQSWNAVVIAIGNRDKILSCLKNELRLLNEDFKTIISEIEQVKKMSRKEMERNEQLTVVKNRILRDIDICKMRMDEEVKKRDQLQKELADNQGIVEQLEEDLSKVVSENLQQNNVMLVLMKEVDKLNEIKGTLEEEILKKLEIKLTNDKAAMNLNKIVRDLKKKNLETETILLKCENKNANVQLQHSMMKITNEETHKGLLQLEAELKQVEEEANAYDKQYRHYEQIINRNQHNIDVLNDQLQKMLDRPAVDTLAGLRLRNSNLERDIRELHEKNTGLQKTWLREQSNLVGLTEQRQEQIQTMNLLRKQIMILEQKNLRINDDLEVHEKHREKLNRQIHGIQARMATLADLLYRQRGIKMNLDKDNDVVQQDYVYKLKDTELECLQIQAEIAEIEEEKLVLSNELVELNRTRLEWEKKLLLAKETKDNMNTERSEGGEVGNMKAEIHRMNVRYSQLKKAQEKLIHDLEHCVSRRDAILAGSEAREKRMANGTDQTRFNFLRKLDDMRNKIKQMENETENMRMNIERLDKEKNEVLEEIEKITNEIKVINDQIEELKEATENAITEKHMSFEIFLHFQKKTILYNDVLKGRKPFMTYRGASVLTTEYNKQKEINQKLEIILTNLRNDFPNHNQAYSRIFNTLKSSLLATYR